MLVKKQHLLASLRKTERNIFVPFSLATGFFEELSKGVGSVYCAIVALSDLTPVKKSALTIEADTITIEAVSKNETTSSAGIVALSAGDVKVAGNTVIPQPCACCS